MRTWLAGVIVAVGCGSKAPPPVVANKPPPMQAEKAAPPAPAQKRDFRVDVVPTRSDGAQVEGTFRDGASRDALAGVTIVLTSPALQGELTAITDERGAFVIGQKLPAGKYTLTAYYADVQTSTTFDVEDGKTVRVSAAIDASGHGGDVVAIAEKPVEYKSAMAALQAGDMEQAMTLGQKELAHQPSSRLHAVLALAKYGSALEVFQRSAFNGHDGPMAPRAREAMTRLLSALDDVQHHISEAAKDPNFALELCVACIASSDSLFHAVPAGALDIERDRAGHELPENDARRRPTYRFDVGDLAWARAMLSFQQGLANLSLAYDWSFLDTLDKGDIHSITIKLSDPARVAKARELFLAGLAASDEARKAYLAETDDDREWVPNPKQHNYAVPLAVDAKLYATWEQVVVDARQLVAGETGLSLADLWKLTKAKTKGPTGFLDFGAMLKSPKDIVIEIDALDEIEHEKDVKKQNARVEKFLAQLLGDGYKRTMKPSKLATRISALRADLDKEHGEALVEDKLKYLFWLN